MTTHPRSEADRIVPPAAPSPHLGGRLTEPLARVLGTRTAQSLAKLDLVTVGDLLRHYPRRYGEPGEMTPIRDLRVGEHVTVQAQVRSATTRPMRNRGGAMLEAIVTDGRDSLRLTFFAKRIGVLRMHEDKLRAGRTGLFTGTVGEYRGERQLTHPDYLIVGVDAADEDEAALEASRPIPIYPSAAGVPTWRIGRAVRTVLDPLTAADVEDPIPAGLLERHHHGTLLEAWRGVHVPETQADWQAGRKRLVYEEALVLQAALARRRAEHDSHATVARPGRSDGALDAFDAQVPWPLTGAQVRAGQRIAADLARETPMLRLLQGDVGSGKTLVALRAMLQVVDAGGQAALLAPTEVLAAQHLRSLRAMLGPLADAGALGGDARGTRVALLTGSQGAKARRQALADAASGTAGIVVGTHALLSETVQFADLGLVVVDEQHRFGVEQRDALRTRGAHPPHMLVMTATPIPRTVAMTVFGDLETTVLDERPPGRADVVTHVVPAGNRAWIDRVWARVAEEVAEGRRAYVVCPRIDEADAADAMDVDAPEAGVEDLADEARLPLDADAVKGASAPRPRLAAATQIAEMLRSRPELAGVRVGLLHGRLSGDDKDAAMSAFSAGRTPVLVSTTVIEVGVDVPEASVMVVLDAQHFGISQLHQLRGRIGRGGLPGVCLLVTSAEEGTLAAERLAAVAGTTDGFELADKDVELRREGDVLGTAQSGGRNSLRLLRVVRDAAVIAQARDDARALVAADPALSTHRALAMAIDEWLGAEQAEYLERG
ncbi:ATP-dependent DNA helicase RecG [Demequina capsici]|uniref:Probable DNA 3'-5' helicase RecG n=1 Tax=Demequina capsici TaxID=3075620 RepID=A0AA96F8U8_9MICO|nr:ATP-dependent DNA helicase RecG [Demequina sp. OYTSA14]WNM25384.1 ATP-dependent DNA helicase RecG [Demequina sp. OYTSA14]